MLPGPSASEVTICLLLLLLILLLPQWWLPLHSSTDLYFAEQTASGTMAVSAGQFNSGPYRSTDSISLAYTDGSPCGSSSYSTTVIFQCRPGLLLDFCSAWNGLAVLWNCEWFSGIIWLSVNLFWLIVSFILHNLCLQCFDAVGWAAGRASGL